MRKLILALFLIPTCVFAQQNETVSASIDRTILDSLHMVLRAEILNLEAAKQKALAMGLPVSGSGEDGAFMSIRSLRNGQIMYYNTTNLNSAKTDGSNKLWSGGGLGLSLNGSGIVARVWDAGAIKTTHQELNGRASMGVSQTATLSDHATHVSGTIAAFGVDASAKGHANQAEIKGFDWDFDTDEMTTEAGNGMLVSNHSYSYIAGWYFNGGTGQWEWYGDGTVSTVEDYIFGNYLDESRNVDLIVNASPYYLPVIAAANDRDDNVPTGATYKMIWDGTIHTTDGTQPNPDGTYDCIPGGLQTAKNTLTVGAVNDIVNGYLAPGDVVLTGFTSYGPCDDGRIKPDVVANGTSLHSCVSTSTTSYSDFSGTSMAAPSVTGSVVLLQQHHHNIFGTYMLNATAKAVIIHTVDKASATFGPTYSYGWGLMNTDGAALLISDALIHPIRIQERNLPNGGTYNFTGNSNGSEPLKITIAWNDPAASVPTPALDPVTKMLVNDLDLRVTRLSDNTVFYPYKLNPASPGTAAITGDNNTDNVEYVYLATPSAGDYKITINHKGTLSGGDQDYTIVVSGLSCIPYSLTENVTITAPATYTLPNGSIVSTSGTYTSNFTTSLGCDSTIITNLTVNTFTCAVPTGLFTNSITSNSARVNWTAVPGATKYQIYYRPVGGATWIKKTATTNSKKLTGLAANTTYEYKVKTQCDPYPASGFSALVNFTTLPLREGEITSESESSLVIYPNPAEENCTVSAEGIADGVYHMYIINLQGQKVVEQTILFSGDDFTVDVKNLASGMYNLVLSNNNTHISDILVIAK
ncbi:MAG TPA: S8 family serine peptidase [Chitinophagales bacterium]|nr:S8 family serine peptidase [Chitinophagales bacterium]